MSSPLFSLTPEEIKSSTAITYTITLDTSGNGPKYLTSYPNWSYTRSSDLATKIPITRNYVHSKAVQRVLKKSILPETLIMPEPVQASGVLFILCSSRSLTVWI